MRAHAEKQEGSFLERGFKNSPMTYILCNVSRAEITSKGNKKRIKQIVTVGVAGIHDVTGDTSFFKVSSSVYFLEYFWRRRKIAQ